MQVKMLQSLKLDKTEVLKKLIKVGSAAFSTKETGFHNNQKMSFCQKNDSYFMAVVMPNNTDKSCHSSLNLVILVLERFIYTI